MPLFGRLPRETDSCSVTTIGTVTAEPDRMETVVGPVGRRRRRINQVVVTKSLKQMVLSSLRRPPQKIKNI
jgi:hypothetical protein